MRHRLRRAFSRILCVTVTIYILIVLALMLFETRLVYPGAYLATRPPADGRLTRVVEYTSRDGNQIKGRLLEREECENFVLFMHGNLSKAQRLDPWAERLSNAFDATVLLAEYRGYEDDLTPTEQGLVTDCHAARDYLCSTFGIKNSDIILYGRSLGGGCGVALAADGGAKALVLERTYDELVGIASRQYPWVPVRLVMRNRFESIGLINQYAGPVVIIHGTNDELIPIECPRRLHQAIEGEKKILIEVSGLEHNGNLPQETLRQAVDSIKTFAANPE